MQKGILTNFAKFTGKELCQSLFSNKVAGLYYYEISKNTFLIETSGRHEILFSTRSSTIFENIKRIVYQYLSEQLLTTKIFLHKTPYKPLFHQKICAVHRRCSYKHPLFTIFLIVFTVDEVCYISNKHQPFNNLAKHQYFYTRDFISLRHFEKRLALSIANVFRNIHFLPLFHYI